MFDHVAIPADPHERRRLWRQWIHTDAPQGDRPIVRRAIAREGKDADWLPEVLSAPPCVVAGLKRAVQESMVGEFLPVTDRERLIRRSMKLGLSRFEANLLIAAVQHRTREQASIPARRMAPRPWNLASLILAVLIAEAVAVLAVLRFFIAP